MAEFLVTEFGGLRNDRARKLVAENYFYEAKNMNYNSLSGADKFSGINTAFTNGTTENVNGIYDFVYESLSNQSVTENMAVVGGSVYKDILTAPVQIYSGLNASAKCTFTILNDRLFVSNGVDYPIIYDGVYIWEMGAPRAEVLPVSGNLNGNYYYAMTHVIGGVESYSGTISNRVLPGNQQVKLEVPLGPTDVTERRVYRTVANGNTPKLLTTIADNITLFYTDNSLDSALGVSLIPVNDEMPKPKFLQTHSNRLVGAVNTNNPTLLYTTETQKEYFTNLRGTINVSGTSNDNTPLVGMSQDYNLVVAASQEQIYTIDLSAALPTSTQTRSNVGALSGYSMIRIPDNQYTDLNGNNYSFAGGVMFISSIGDIRVFNGNFALPVATTLDNLKTQNWSSFIQSQLSEVLRNQTQISCGFFDYKYHLCIDSNIFVFDVRGNKWSRYELGSGNEISCMGDLNSNLYIGILNQGKIGAMYEGNDMFGTAHEAIVETSDLLASEGIKRFKELHLFFNDVTLTVPVTATIEVEGDEDDQIIGEINLQGGYYDSRYFDSNYFDTGENTNSDDVDYRVININKYGRWMSFKLNTTGFLSFRGYRLIYEEISNQEVG
tara:strand:- start:5783 stop:7606 length:1824 start_codon:yes stop_codon:yes gene_type:complete